MYRLILLVFQLKNILRIVYYNMRHVLCVLYSIYQYKEAFDFEKADRIIVEGMGSHFDPGLQSAYKMARPELEEYYGSL